MSLPENPITRKETFYSVIAGQNDTSILPDPVTREEEYLAYIAVNGGGGGGGGDVTGVKGEAESSYRTGNVTITAANVDAYTKTETDTLLGGKISTTAKGSASGVAELDSNGKVPSAQLPSYVDDVIEGYLNENDGKFYEDSSYTTEITGTTGKIYVSLDTEKCYRWGGSEFVEISESLALGETSSTAYAGNKGKANADAIAAIKDGLSLDSFGDVESALADKVSKSNTTGLLKNDGTVDETTYQPSTMSASVTVGAEMETTVEGAIGEIADVIPSNAGTSNKLSTARDIANEEISASATGTSFSLTDAADGNVQNIVIKGRTDSSTAASVGDNGLTITTTDGTASTAATITTALPLRSYSESVYDELNMLVGTVTTRCGYEGGTVTELATPVITPLTPAEMTALTNLKTYTGTTNISCTDSPTMTVNYLLDTDNGQAAADMQVNILHALAAISPKQHRMIFRGKCLGTSPVTVAELADVKDGSFRDKFIGDYWFVNNIHWRLADMDFLLHCGDTPLERHHLVIVPDEGLVTAPMNDSDTTAGGYYGSAMHNSGGGLDQAASVIVSAFPLSVIVTYDSYLTNQVSSNGYPNGASIYRSTVELLNENMVYGHREHSAVNNGSNEPTLHTFNKTQLALFQIAPEFITTGYRYWLQDVVSLTNFADVHATGYSDKAPASNGSRKVRPFFVIG